MYFNMSNIVSTTIKGENNAAHSTSTNGGKLAKGNQLSLKRGGGIHPTAHGTDRVIVSSHLGQQSKQLEPPAVPDVEEVREPVVHHRLGGRKKAVPTRLRVLDLDQHRVLNGGDCFYSTTLNGFRDITVDKNGVTKNRVILNQKKIERF